MLCVRCCEDTADKVAIAPDGSEAWEVYYCGNCNYSWRSTEEDEVTVAAMRDQYFQLKGVDMTKLMVPVPLPPLIRNK